MHLPLVLVGKTALVTIQTLWPPVTLKWELVVYSTRLTALKSGAWLSPNLPHNLIKHKLPLPITRARGAFFFSIWKNLSRQDMLSVCSAISYQKRTNRLSRGTWNTAAQFVKRGYAAKAPLLAAQFAFILRTRTTDAHSPPAPPLDKIARVW